MTKRIGNTVYIEGEPESKCELCGKIEELRPYGPNSERVCFKCGMKDEEAAKERFGQLINNDSQEVH